MARKKAFKHTPLRTEPAPRIPARDCPTQHGLRQSGPSPLVIEDLHLGRGDTEAAEARALELRRALASAIRALDPSELFVVHEARAAAPFPEGDEPPPLEEAGALGLIDHEVYDVTVESLRRYHGNSALCGLCLVWSLVRQLGRHAGVEAFERRSVEVTAGARGSGILDGLEYLFRGFGEGRASFKIGRAHV